MNEEYYEAKKRTQKSLDEWEENVIKPIKKLSNEEVEILIGLIIEKNPKENRESLRKTLRNIRES